MARIYRVKLFKIKSVHNNVRTDTIEGKTRDLPTLDQDFFMYGPGLEFGTRLLRTTEVMSLARLGNTILFTTRNSTYTLMIEGEYDDEAETSSTGGR